MKVKDFYMVEQRCEQALAVFPGYSPASSLCQKAHGEQQKADTLYNTAFQHFQARSVTDNAAGIAHIDLMIS
eukprot:SAG31_NODE_2621_length_5362_cov_5.185256_2_plen_72_part_00